MANADVCWGETVCRVRARNGSQGYFRSALMLTNLKVGTRLGIAFGLGVDQVLSMEDAAVLAEQAAAA